MNWALIGPPLMLAVSNLVMNFAWYGHLKVPTRALWLTVLASWGLAFVEYCFVVPAVRLGSQSYTLPQLKTFQLFFSATMFLVMAWVTFGQKPGLSQLAGFTLIVAGAALVFRGPA